jgi:diadenosine tetraphosphate (Ap4A) HIT family hydrolase
MRKIKGSKGETVLGDEHADCVFCSEVRAAAAVATHGSTFAVQDLYPVTEGHLLIIPRRHTPDFFSMTETERADTLALIDELRRRVTASDPSVLGFNIGMNCGEAAGQTVMHAHVHLIPRRRGDTPNPRGGVRGVIPGRMAY